jgi:hypothetical protein
MKKTGVSCSSYVLCKQEFDELLLGLVNFEVSQEVAFEQNFMNP